MIESSEELLEIVEDEEEKKPYKLGIVKGLFGSGVAQVQFDGEEEPSEKEYPYISTFRPSVGDRIVLTLINGIYVILGTIETGKPPDDKNPTYSSVEVKGKVSAGSFSGTSLNVSSIQSSSIQSNSGNIGKLKTDSLETSSLSLRNQLIIDSLKVNNKITSGTIDTASIKTSNLDISNNFDASSGKFRSTLSVETLNHTGSTLAFFNGRYSYKKNVSTVSTSANVSDVARKLNELISVLSQYNLV